MIETTVLNFLSGKLRVPVLAEGPEKPPGSFAVVEKTGGGRSTGLKQATVAVQSYGETLLQAARLDDDVVEAMAELATLTGVGACRLVRDYNFTDTANRRYRYQAVFEIVYY